MKFKETGSKKLYKEYIVDIPYSSLDDLINEKINNIISTVTIPGFRKGKAPLEIVKKKYEGSVLSESLEKLIQNCTKELIDKTKITPYRLPKIDIKKYEKNQDIEVELKIDLKPEIKLKNFDKLKITKYEIDLDKKTIEENYNLFLKSQSQYSKIKNDRLPKSSDKIIANLTSLDQSIPDYLKNQNNVNIILDSDYQILPDINKKILEKKVKSGDKIKLNFDLSKLNNDKKKSNVDFEIEIISIEELIPFKINNDFLKKNGLKNEKELMDNLNKNLLSQFELGLKQIEKKQLMDLLDNEHNFEIPEGVLDEEFHEVWHKLQHAKDDGRLDDDDKNLSDEELKERYKIISERRVKLAILLQHIAQQEKIVVNEKELTDGILNYASQYPGQEKQILEFFKKNPSKLDAIRGPIFEEKVVDLIKSKANKENQKINVKDFKKLEEKTFSIKKG